MEIFTRTTVGLRKDTLEHNSSCLTTTLRSEHRLWIHFGGVTENKEYKGKPQTQQYPQTLYSHVFVF